MVMLLFLDDGLEFFEGVGGLFNEGEKDGARTGRGAYALFPFPVGIDAYSDCGGKGQLA